MTSNIYALLFIFFIVPNLILAQTPCMDLQATQIAVISQKRKTAKIEITIQNTGNQVWEQTQSLGVQAFWSGDKKFNPGDILCGGIAPTKCTNSKKLSPNETTILKMKINLYKKTKFNNYLIVVLDPFFTIDECDETNNTNAILVR